MSEINGGYADKTLPATQTGVVPSNALSNQFLTGIGANGAVTRAQPAAADLSDYEIFTFPVTDQSSAGLTITVGQASGFRLGKAVKLYISVTYPSTADTNTATLSLPFTVATSVEGAFGGKVTNATGATPQYFTIPSGSNIFRIRNSSFGFCTNANLSGLSIRGQLDFLLS